MRDGQTCRGDLDLRTCKGNNRTESPSLSPFRPVVRDRRRRESYSGLIGRRPRYSCSPVLSIVPTPTPP